MLESICISLMSKQFNNPKCGAEIRVMVTGKEVKTTVISPTSKQARGKSKRQNPEKQAINHTRSNQKKTMEMLGKAVELAILRKGLFGLAMLKWLQNRK